jgi:hypothetical protein
VVSSGMAPTIHLFQRERIIQFSGIIRKFGIIASRSMPEVLLMRRPFALVLCVAGLLLGQDKKWHTAIHVDVDASTPELKDAIVSYITSEIHSVGDVGVDNGACLPCT